MKAIVFRRDVDFSLFFLESKLNNCEFCILFLFFVCAFNCFLCLTRTGKQQTLTMWYRRKIYAKKTLNVSEIRFFFLHSNELLNVTWEKSRIDFHLNWIEPSTYDTNNVDIFHSIEEWIIERNLTQFIKRNSHDKCFFLGWGANNKLQEVEFQNSVSEKNLKICTITFSDLIYQTTWHAMALQYFETCLLGLQLLSRR